MNGQDLYNQVKWGKRELGSLTSEEKSAIKEYRSGQKAEAAYNAGITAAKAVENTEIPVPEQPSMFERAMNAVSPSTDQNDGMSFDQFLKQSNVNQEFVANNPTLSKVMAAPGFAMQTIGELLPQSAQDFASRASDAAGEIMTGVDKPNKPNVGNEPLSISKRPGSVFEGLPLTPDNLADLTGTLIGFVGNPKNGVQNVGGSLWNAAEGLAGQIVKRIAPKTPELAQTAMKVAGATVPFEAAMAINNNRGMNPGEMAESAAANALLGAITHGVARNLNKGNKVNPTDATLEDLFGENPKTRETDIKTDVKIDPSGQYGSPLQDTKLPFQPNPITPVERMRMEWTAPEKGGYAPEVKNPYGPTPSRVVDASKLPDEYPVPNSQIISTQLEQARRPPALPGGNEVIALPRPGEVVNWDIYEPKYDFSVDQSGATLPRGSGPPSLIPGRDYSIKGGKRNPIEGDGYISRSDIGDPAYIAELQNRYNEIISAEVKALKDELGGVVIIPEKGIRASQNPQWYQDFWAKNGRAPREGEYRNKETGDLADPEFIKVISELSRGQKLPQEWHDLTAGMKEFEGMNEPSLAPLIKDMKAERAKVEPYGLNRNLENLSEIEANTRRNMIDQMDYDQYQGVNFKSDKAGRFIDRGQINSYVDDSITGDGSGAAKSKVIGAVTPTEAQRIKDINGIDTTGYKHELTRDDLRHMMKQHGDTAAESAKGQLAVTPDDLKLIPDIISTYDNIYEGTTKGSRRSIVYEKKANGAIFYVEVIATKQKALRSKTMWKEPSAKNDAPLGAAPVHTSKTDSSLIPSTDITLTPEGIKGNGGQEPNLKRSQQPLEIEILNEGIQKKIGPFKYGTVEHAPEAMNNPEFAAANELARVITGKDVIPFKGQDVHGVNIGDTVYLNAKTKQPMLYVASHEITHAMETTHPEHYAKLEQIVREHVADTEGLSKHYSEMGYKPEELPRELTSDALAESMIEPTFWARVREKSPELLKPILDTLDRIINTFRQKAGDDMTILPYLKNVETMRNRLADAYKEYLTDVKAGKAAPIEGDMAAKLKQSSSTNPADQLKAMILEGESIFPKSRAKGAWIKRMEERFPEVAGRDNSAQIMDYVWVKAQEMRKNGSATIKTMDGEISVAREELKAPTEQMDSVKPEPTDDTIPPGGNEATPETGIEYKDIAGRQMYSQDIYRNTEQFFGKDMQMEPGSVVDRFNEAKGSHVDYQNNWLEKLKEVTDDLGIKKGSRLSALVQRFGEGGTDYFEKAPKNKQWNKKAEEKLIKQYGEGNVTPEIDEKGKLIGWMVHQPYTEEMLIKDVGKADAQKVKQAIQWFKTSYKELLTDINKVRAEIYPNAEKRMADIEAEIDLLRDYKASTAQINDRLNKYYDQIDDINNSPKRDAGRKKEMVAEIEAKIEKLRNSPLYTKEGRMNRIEQLELEYEKAMRGKFVPEREDYFRHFRELTGLGGMKNILGTPAEISPELAGRSEFTLPKSRYHGFMQKRGWGAYKEDAVGGFLNYLPEASYSVHIDPMISKFEGLADDLSTLTTKTRDANNFIKALRLFSQDLAGKTNPIDRVAQDVIGRRNMQFLVWLNNRAKSNAIKYNLATPIIQPTNIVQGVAFAKQHTAVGIGRAIIDIFSKEPLRNQSAFLKERFQAKNYRQFDTRLIDQPNKFANWLLEFSDRIGTEAVWYSAYQKGLAKGVNDPVKFADANTRKLVAGRGIGEMPLTQKSKLVQTFLPFTLEVGNMWKVQKDFVKAKDFAGLVTLYAGLWVANNMIENVRGDRPLFDPVDAVQQAAKIMAEDSVKSTGNKALRAGGRLGGEVLSNIPGGQFAAQLYPENGMKIGDTELPTRKELFGDSDPTRFGTGILPVKAVQDPGKYLLLPGGGAQVDKTLTAAETLNKGGAYTKNDELMYPVSNDPVNGALGLLFGRGAFRETDAYYDDKRRPLSEKQTQQVQKKGNQQAEYDKLMKQRKIDSLNEQIAKTRKDKKLTANEKKEQIRILNKQLKESAADK